MKFSISAAALLAFVAQAVAQTTDTFNVMTSPKKDEVVKAGETFQIVWQYNDKFPGLVSISLIGGKDQGHLYVLLSSLTAPFFH